MATVPVERAILQEVLARRDDLVQAISRGVVSQDWEPVMAAFDALLVALKRLEATLAGSQAPGGSGADRREPLDRGAGGE